MTMQTLTVVGVCGDFPTAQMSSPREQLLLPVRTVQDFPELTRAEYVLKTRLTLSGKIASMATTIVSSKGQVVIPRALREKYRLASGTRLEIGESDEGLVLAPLRRPRSSRRQAGWRALRGSAKGTNALKEHLAEHRREAKR